MSAIILEGPDGAGKTTLARQLAERYGYRYEHEGPPPAGVDLLVYYGNKLDAARGHNVVFDRLALGELVYGAIVRGTERFNVEHWRVFHRLITAMGAREIYCLPDYDVCRNNWAGRHDELFDREDTFKRVYDRYADICIFHPITAGICYDYKSVSAFQYVLDYVQDPDTYMLAPYYIGSPTARYLLVGDRGAHEDCDLPFFANDFSSGWLTRVLDMAGFTEEEVAWTNAWHHLPQPGYTPIETTNAAGQPWTVIALGSAASHTCKKQGVEHHRVSHPQYEKRFHYHEIDKYATAFRACRTPGLTTTQERLHAG